MEFKLFTNDTPLWMRSMTPWDNLLQIMMGNDQLSAAEQDSTSRLTQLSDAIRICDYKEQSGLLPFMLASEGRRSDLSCVFELMRMRPDLLDVLGSGCLAE